MKRKEPANTKKKGNTKKRKGSFSEKLLQAFISQSPKFKTLVREALSYKIDWMLMIPQSYLDGTLLHWACEFAQKGQPDLLNLFLDDKEAKVNWMAALTHRDNPSQGQTLLHGACALAQRGQPDLLKRFLDDKEAKVNWMAALTHQDNPNQGQTLLHWACALAQRGQPDLLKRFLDDKEAKVNWMAALTHQDHPNQGQTLLHGACAFAEKGQPDLLKRFLDDKEAKVNWMAALTHQNSLAQGDTLLHWACALAEKGQPDLSKRFLDDKEAKVNWMAALTHQDHPNQGHTLLHWACEFAQKGQPDLLKRFLDDKEAKVNWMAAPTHQNSRVQGQTLLHGACVFARKGQPDLLKRFLDDKEAKVNWMAALTYQNNRTLLHEACLLADEDKPQLLKRFFADTPQTETASIFARLFKSKYSSLLSQQSSSYLSQLAECLPQDVPEAIILKTYISLILTLQTLKPDSKQVETHLAGLQGQPNLHQAAYQIVCETSHFDERVNYLERVTSNNGYFKEAQWQLANHYYCSAAAISSESKEFGKTETRTDSTQRWVDLQKAFKLALVCRQNKSDTTIKQFLHAIIQSAFPVNEDKIDEVRSFAVLPKFKENLLENLLTELKGVKDIEKIGLHVKLLFQQIMLTQQSAEIATMKQQMTQLYKKVHQNPAPQAPITATPVMAPRLSTSSVTLIAEVSRTTLTPSNPDSQKLNF